MSEVVFVLGYPASGKTTYTLNAFPKHIRINRDIFGGTLVKLAKHFEGEIVRGRNDFVLDNTFATVAQRKPFIDIAKKHKFKVICHWLQATAEDAQVNACKRMISKYGRVLSPDEMPKTDPNCFPATVIFTYRKAFEEPSVDEGFDTLVEVPFIRKYDKSYSNKALILDYDGTLRTTKSGEIYPVSPDDIQVIDGRYEILQKYKQNGYLILGISNQSGIAKKRLTRETADACFRRTNALLGVEIEYRFCPHGSFPISCFCRKPMPGFGVEFIEKYKLNPSETIFVGDMTTDRTFAERCWFNFYEANHFFSNDLEAS